MSDIQALADRVEIEALRGEFTDAGRGQHDPSIAPELLREVALGHVHVLVHELRPGGSEVRVGARSVSGSWASVKGHPAIRDGYPMRDRMQNQSRAPKITKLSWGRIATEAGLFRDAKLWPGGGRNWDWTETGTDHDVGLQPADIQELLDHGARIIVVGRGQHERLSVPQAAISAAEHVGARMEVLPTKAAVERYNALAGQGKLVGALIHTTC